MERDIRTIKNSSGGMPAVLVHIQQLRKYPSVFHETRSKPVKMRISAAGFSSLGLGPMYECMYICMYELMYCIVQV